MTMTNFLEHFRKKIEFSKKYLEKKKKMTKKISLIKDIRNRTINNIIKK